MKILVIGLGSMGKRRLRNLKALNIDNIIGFDLREDRRIEAENKYKIKTFGTFEEAIEQRPDVFIISTPPDTHIDYQLYAAKSNIPFLAEDSVVKDGIEELIEIVNQKNIVGYPSSTLRFHPSVKKVKELVDNNEIGTLCTFTYHAGQYLPDWHPWENVTDFYASKRETGGAREIVAFELRWLTWIFGDIKSVYGDVKKTLDFGADIDDIYQVLLFFKSGLVAHMLIDVVSRVFYRTLRLLGEEGVIEWEWLEKKVKCYKSKINNWEIYNLGSGTTIEGYDESVIEEPYINELKEFLDAVKGKDKASFTLEEDYHILDILYKIEESSEKKKMISI
ncbi:MAG: Gfo/Idh/MocA family protein [Promethearchaeota archaeon]